VDGKTLPDSDRATEPAIGIEGEAKLPTEVDQDCVPADPNDRSTGPGPSVAQWEDLDLDVLATAFPEAVGRLKSGKVGQMQRGMAGHGAPNVSAQYKDEDGETIFVSIVDTQHQCGCREGMGQRLAKAGEGGPRAHRLEFEGNPGVATTSESGASHVGIWVGDRCAVHVNSGGVELAKAVAAKLEWSVLRTECTKRRPK
jgi:hypothetical protein